MGSFYYIKSRDLIAWNYYTTENIGKAKNERTQKVLNYKPANTINYCVTVRPMMKDLSIAVNLFYRSKVFINDTNTEELDGFTTLNIDLNYKINGNLSLWQRVLIFVILGMNFQRIILCLESLYVWVLI
jgi:outer membrane cobalamin receptor